MNIEKSLRKASFLLPLFLFLAVFYIPMAYAYDASAALSQHSPTAGYDYTETEKAMFAFYNLVGSEPDFTKYIESRDKYKRARPVKKVEMMQSEKTRLKVGFNNFRPSESIITLTLPATMYASNSFYFSQQEGAMTEVRFELEDMQEGFLPLELDNHPIALIFEELDELTRLNLNAVDYYGIAVRAGLDKAHYLQEKDVKVDIIFKGMSVDRKGPLMMPNGFEMWVMLGEIVEFIVWIENNVQNRVNVYHYHADGYHNDKRKELMNLYSE